MDYNKPINSKIRQSSNFSNKIGFNTRNADLCIFVFKRKK